MFNITQNRRQGESTYVASPPTSQLAWDEFHVLAGRSAAGMHVIDWIPLSEIDTVEFNVQAKQASEAEKLRLQREEEYAHTGLSRLPSNEQHEKLKRSASVGALALPQSEAKKRLGSHVGDTKRGWMSQVLSRVESYTGLDIDGNGALGDGALSQVSRAPSPALYARQPPCSKRARSQRNGHSPTPSSSSGRFSAGPTSGADAPLRIHTCGNTLYTQHTCGNTHTHARPVERALVCALWWVQRGGGERWKKRTLTSAPTLTRIRVRSQQISIRTRTRYS